MRGAGISEDVIGGRVSLVQAIASAGISIVPYLRASCRRVQIVVSAPPSTVTTLPVT
jgi:hypothetical protein